MIIMSKTIFKFKFSENAEKMLSKTDYEWPILISDVYLKLGNPDLMKQIDQQFSPLKIRCSQITKIKLQKKYHKQQTEYYLIVECDKQYKSRLNESTYYDFYFLNEKLASIEKLQYTIKIAEEKITFKVNEYLGQYLKKPLYVGKIVHNDPKTNIVETIARKYFGQDIIDVTSDRKYKNLFLAT